MKANGIARFGLGCALALTVNPVYAASLNDLRIREVIPDPSTLTRAVGAWFELSNPNEALFHPAGTAAGDDSGNLLRIESDLLIVPREYRTLARTAGPGFATDRISSVCSHANSGDEYILRDPLGDTPWLDYGRSFGAHGRLPCLSALTISIQNAIRNFVAAMRGVST